MLIRWIRSTPEPAVDLTPVFASGWHWSPIRMESRTKKQKRFTEEQIIEVLRAGDAGP